MLLLSAVRSIVIYVFFLVESLTSQSDQVFPLKFAVDVARLQPIRTAYKNGDIMYDRLVRTIIPSIVKHIEDTYESYDIEKIRITN